MKIKTGELPTRLDELANELYELRRRVIETRTAAETAYTALMEFATDHHIAQSLGDIEDEKINPHSPHVANIAARMVLAESLAKKAKKHANELHRVNMNALVKYRAAESAAIDELTAAAVATVNAEKDAAKKTPGRGDA